MRMPTFSVCMCVCVLVCICVCVYIYIMVLCILQQREHTSEQPIWLWRYAENRVKKLSLDIPASTRTLQHNNIDYRGDFTIIYNIILLLWMRVQAEYNKRICVPAYRTYYTYICGYDII